jgi:beta-xylosidase
MSLLRNTFACLLAASPLWVSQVKAQSDNYVSNVWVADNKNGTYKNPILNADYSDPDAIRVGDDYYMIASSFDQVPGLPVLHSKDLVNWKIIGHALAKQPPFEVYNTVQHGNGVWAPAIRYHKGEFWIYFPDPEFGIYVTKAKNAAGPWSEPVLVEAGKGLIDPCPFWDEDGKVYLAMAYAGSRAGFKSILAIKEMNAEGTKVTGNPVMIFDGNPDHKTVEGPKMHKRNGYYYVFAPAGGVATGWQLVLRSKNIYGPYEHKIVMDQGTTSVNGPHQGAWVDTQTGEDWFIHFQDKDAYGRVVHLQPMKWVNDWPVIGEDKDDDGKGNPVMVYKKPNVGKGPYPVVTPVESDQFNEPQLGLQWQWAANYDQRWGFVTGRLGYLRLYAFKNDDTTRSLWNRPNRLTQKTPADNFKATIKLTFKPKFENDKVGLLIMGQSYAYIGIRKTKEGNFISYVNNKVANKKGKEEELLMEAVKGEDIYLRVEVKEKGICTFSYSFDNKKFTMIPRTFTATPGQWIGAKVGMFCTSETKTNDAGYADIDWFVIDKN